jgi:hypothetical protein
MAAMLESDTHFDASTLEAATRTSGLLSCVAKCLPDIGTNIDPVAGGRKRVITANGAL